VLVDPEIVLSAAHCFRGQNYDLIADPSSVSVSAGANLGVHLDLWSTVTAITITPEYSWTWGTNESLMDLAILRLTDPVTNTETYRISDRAEPPVGTVVQIVGYGTSQAGANDGFIHRDGVAVVLPDENEDRGRITFAFGKPSHSCWGDSGGPVFSMSGDRWVLSGIIHGVLPDCASKSWAVDLSIHRKWIQTVFREWTGRDAPIGPEIPIATPKPSYIAFLPIVSYP
jgi:secreted trypsin-like serine protease